MRAVWIHVCSFALGLCMGATCVAQLAADEPVKAPRIGVLMIPLENSPVRNGLEDGLRKLGYVDGKNIVFDWRMPGATEDELRSAATDLARQKVDLIIVGTTPAGRTVLDATTLPVVFLLGDPIAAGLAASLAKPGGRATGVSILTTELAGKRLELLRAVTSKRGSVAFMLNSANPNNAWQLKEVKDAARALRVELTLLDLHGSGGIDALLSRLPQTSASGVVIAAELGFFVNRAKIAEAVRKAKMPAIFPATEYHDSGVLLSYGPNLTNAGRVMASYVDRILRGAQPAELPIEQISKFELVVDLREARRIGVTIPHTVLQRADDVIR